MKLRNMKLAGMESITSHGVVQFDSNGVADVPDSWVDLATVWERVDEPTPAESEHTEQVDTPDASDTLDEIDPPVSDEQPDLPDKSEVNPEVDRVKHMTTKSLIRYAGEHGIDLFDMTDRSSILQLILAAIQ